MGIMHGPVHGGRAAGDVSETHTGDDESSYGPTTHCILVIYADTSSCRALLRSMEYAG
jgi:hypothetical protein